MNSKGRANQVQFTLPFSRWTLFGFDRNYGEEIFELEK
jgi:hypothetical protein